MPQFGRAFALASFAQWIAIVIDVEITAADTFDRVLNCRLIQMRRSMEL
jgi:hypothetical protein